MHPILLSLLLGLSAAAANVFGGVIIVRNRCDRSYLKYFVALGAGFMLATSIIEIFAASLELRGKSAAFLVLVGYLIIHFFEHTVTPHFHFGEETHEDEFVQGHKGYSVLIGLLIHTFFDGIAIASGFIVSNWLGWIIFLAVFLHKIPEGFTVDFRLVRLARPLVCDKCRRAWDWSDGRQCCIGYECRSLCHGKSREVRPETGAGRSVHRSCVRRHSADCQLGGNPYC